VLTGEVQPRSGLTPYVRFGNWPILAVLWLALAVIAVSCRRSIRR
jgi:apolipoprotein N-acyltransferase